jgi:serine/threonine protein kinase
VCFLYHLAFVSDTAGRDLKTENLLVDRNGKLKICDLGLARKLTPKKDEPTFNRPHAMTVCGTNEFMSRASSFFFFFSSSCLSTHCEHVSSFFAAACVVAPLLMGSS